MRVQLIDPSGESRQYDAHGSLSNSVDVAYVTRMLGEQGIEHAISTNGDRVFLEVSDLDWPKARVVVAGLGLETERVR